MALGKSKGNNAFSLPRFSFRVPYLKGGRKECEARYVRLNLRETTRTVYVFCTPYGILHTSKMPGGSLTIATNHGILSASSRSM